MTTLNLLPPAQKEKIKKMAIYSICENLVASIFITLTVISIIFLISNNILQTNLAHFISKTTEVPKDIQQLNANIKELNSQLKDISDIQKGFIKWSNFFININPLIPEKIQIKYIEVSPKEETYLLKLSGLAATRDDFLIFQKNLEDYSLFTKVKSPLSNILKQKNIEFTFDIELADLNK